ncbi:UNKNOWN [Stylonychia lemnae]|uniref:Transglycosylase SLT domain-containing protein n=1 Tax=Stylonychia lemnae TaxID=5949 RepID=A0A078APF0_STYLE|nr:UNKNOWN [Stylonychia lemnae]|eukprot:CDW84019.1 UNKNOWN [Stylonychia lemnae]
MQSVSKIAVLLALGLALVMADNCGGNCPSGNCKQCICPAPTYTDIAAACARWSGWSQSCCECIVKHESGGNTHAQLWDSDGSNDIGLWQINSVNWGQCNGGNAPCDVNSNFECAKKIFGWGGNSWRLWSTCSACGCCGHGFLQAEETLQ